MLTKNERKKTIVGIQTLISLTGKREEGGTTRRYSINLPHCSVDVLKLSPTTLLVEIAEHSTAEVDYQPAPFDIVKKLYRGSADGLEEVALKGFYGPDPEGKMCPIAEKLLRFQNSTDGRKPTENDHERFDRWLQYTVKELTKL